MINLNIKKAKPQSLVQRMFINALPQRKPDAHKGSFGSVAVIGGAASMSGAVLLSARAALLTGTGRTYASMLSAYAPNIDFLHPEIMFRPPADLAKLEQLDCLVIGPGLGQADGALELLEFWLNQNKKLLIDADALNLIAKHADLAKICKKRKADTVITPHVGEAARLLKASSEDVQLNRIDSAIQLADELKVTCVLKGAGTVITHYDGSCFVNTTGNVGLASGGTGDVLSGVIASLMGQGMVGMEAAKLGVFVHGAAADALVARDIGPIGLTASEVTIEVRNIINQLSRK